MHLNTFDEYPVENFHSLLRCHTSVKVSTGKSLRQDALFLDHFKLSAIFHLDFFNSLWKCLNKAELKKEGKRVKKDYCYFPGIEAQFSFGALPLGYHSNHQPTIDKLCDRPKCMDFHGIMDIDSWTDSQVQDDDEELGNVETISKQIRIDIELKKKISEFVENCVLVESIELLPISGSTLKDITNIIGFKRF
ncbi:hypothetical protein C1645_830029 [Glomus cerebriforme]|uniref:Uncharacterized protein n=1 Tax=Glomus cerebriforme TaxID=658196 RepID=A0A397SMX3_9GLOM|nr:hypothetical protein C1645_830029 [Glomus cerebriforme]